jgi:valyl-tRNA synthetase
MMNRSTAFLGVMPFIIEAIWQKVRSMAGIEGDTMMLMFLPVACGVERPAGRRRDRLGQAVSPWHPARIKGEMNTAPGEQLPV